MRAARLYPGENFLRIEDVPIPEPRAGEILIRVAGAGVCHSDLHLLDDRSHEALSKQPITLGHEISGWVERTGEGVENIQKGTAVVVLCVWGCGQCHWCRLSHQELCQSAQILGSTTDGGFAEYVIVPHQDRLVSIGQLNPVHAAPLGDAALTPYRALERVRHLLSSGSTVVIIGVGGLGEYAIQLARVMTDARIIAIDRRKQRVNRAKQLGADNVIVMNHNAFDQVIVEMKSERVAAVLDFVGSDESLDLAAKIIDSRGMIVMVGLGGGNMPVQFHSMAPEAIFTTLLSGGTAPYLREIVSLSESGRIRGEITTYSLDQINDVLEMLRSGRVDGRAVITPNK